MQPLGFLISLIIYISCFFLASVLLNKFNANTREVIIANQISYIGHLLGAILIMIFKSGDAITYFYNPEFHSTGFIGTGLIINLTQFIKDYLTLGSFLGTYIVYAGVGYLGSVGYLCLLQEQFNSISKNKSLMISHRLLPCLLIACWPSSLVWASILGKDSLTFFLTAIFFLSIHTWKQSWYSKIYLLLSIASLALIRPYLLIVTGMAVGLTIAFTIRNKKYAIPLMISFLFVTFLAFYLCINHFYPRSPFQINTIVAHIFKLREFVSKGTYLTLGIDTWQKLLYLLPLCFAANLYLPLFIFAKNTLGILASIENFMLLFITVASLYNFKKIRSFAKNNKALTFSFCYFLFGMTLLAIINTNLGLASRQKLMYIYPLLVYIVALLSTKKLDKPAQLK